MRVKNYVAVALAILVGLALIAWVLRDSIIQRLSGPMLEEYGLVITDVSLDALATKNAHMSYLELAHVNGARIAIEGLNLPIGESPSGSRSYTADRVTIETGTGDDAPPPDLARVLERLLRLPDSLPRTEVRVRKLAMTPYPVVSDVQWLTTDEAQSLTATLDTVALLAEIRRTAEGRYELFGSLRHAHGNGAGQSIVASLESAGDGFSVQGSAALELPTLSRLASALAAAFEADIGTLDVTTGTAEVAFQIHLPFAADQSATLDATISPRTTVEFTYSAAEAEAVSVSLRSAGPFNLHGRYPGLEWSLEQEQAVLSVSHRDWRDVSVSATRIECRSGPACSWRLEAAVADADLGFLRADRLAVSANQDIYFKNRRLDIILHTDSTFVLSHGTSALARFNRLEAGVDVPAELSISAAGWELTAAGAAGDARGLTAGAGIAFDLPVTLADLAVSGVEETLSASARLASPSADASWEKLRFSVPGFEGRFMLDAGVTTLALETRGLHHAQEATIHVQHDLTSGGGELVVESARLSFDEQTLSERVSGLPSTWEIIAGEVGAELRSNWRLHDSGLQLTGRASVAASGLAGHYADYAFTGFTTGLEIGFDNVAGYKAAPAGLRVELIDVGVPIESVSFDYVPDLNELAADVSNLQMRAFGGIIQSDPFSFGLHEETNEILLRAESIDLGQLLTLKQFEAVELTGTASAELPLTIAGDKVSIENGTLTGDAAGGLIRYRPDFVPEDTGPGTLGYVSRALNNFKYDSLTAALDYDREGNLELRMQILGRNPDFEQGRPIRLALNVDNNIPQMLRSLRATRTVEEILETKLKK